GRAVEDVLRILERRSGNEVPEGDTGAASDVCDRGYPYRAVDARAEGHVVGDDRHHGRERVDGVAVRESLEGRADRRVDDAEPVLQRVGDHGDRTAADVLERRVGD